MSVREKPSPLSLGASPCDAGEVALLTIDLAALARNWKLLAERSAPAECAAVVKADAYGLGLEPVMRALLAAGCRTFFVATAAEGVQARAIARDAVLYMFNGAPPGSGPLLLSHELRPVLNSLDEIAEWAALAPGTPAALHIDTGMSRLGVAPPDAGVAAELARGLSLQLVMSHFVSSQQPENRCNDRQIAQFALARAHFPEVAASFANSSGIFLPHRPHLDLVRPGYALYGGNPTPGKPNPMRPVVKLEARILALREIKPGESVGYDATWTASRPSRLAALGLGYADGLPWGVSSGAGAEPLEALVSGFRCPIVGRVSMDAIVLDLTEAPSFIAQRGDFVEILGETTGVDALAERAGTIGYEILTRLGRRYARRYVGG
ncbi:alanine racemase [Methylocystis bryophila]|uniref:Alanine racemase n=1 Tax=Methylocystis bryophila TaxID=655015 RepID=A0A1W6N0Q9_9HYPH|nr:alanine racemase [Methylocystis bryophila]ARN83432.1 alanine racemase [Methylocystis bryophila]